MSEPLSEKTFEEFKGRVLDSLDKQYALAQSTNSVVAGNTTDIVALKTQMTQVLAHVADQQRSRRDTRVAKIAGACSLAGTFIIALVEILKHFSDK